MPIEYKISETFDDQRVRDFINCVINNRQNSSEKCKAGPEIINYKEAAHEGITPLAFMWRHKQEIDFTPEMLSEMFVLAAHPEEIASAVILDKNIEYYKILLNYSGGPNGLSGRLMSGSSIMHQTIALWSQDKIDYMFDMGVNLEQENWDGDTALLSVRFSDPLEISEYQMMAILLDRGANVHAVDNKGRDICDFLRTGHSSWDADRTLGVLNCRRASNI